MSNDEEEFWHITAQLDYGSHGSVFSLMRLHSRRGG